MNDGTRVKIEHGAKRGRVDLGKGFCAAKDDCLPPTGAKQSGLRRRR